MSTAVHYTQAFPVVHLQQLLRKWIWESRFYGFRGRIIDAIQGHSEGDSVRVRLSTERDVKLFEYVASQE